MSEFRATDTSQLGDMILIKCVHEVMVSLNVGFMATILTFRYGPDSVVSWLYRTDSSIQTHLHIRQTDLATNYFVFFIFSLSIAICVWEFLRLSSNSRLTQEILLLPAAGFLALAVLPSTMINPWNNTGGLQRIVWPIEILFVLYIAYRYLHGSWPRSAWIIGVIIVVHFAFWSREFGPYDEIAWMLRIRQFRAYLLFFPGGVPIAWIVACSSALVWAIYVGRSRQTPDAKLSPV
jgi:hypothetical protein